MDYQTVSKGNVRRFFCTLLSFMQQQLSYSAFFLSGSRRCLTLHGKYAILNLIASCMLIVRRKENQRTNGKRNRISVCDGVMSIRFYPEHMLLPA